MAEKQGHNPAKDPYTYETVMSSGFDENGITTGVKNYTDTQLEMAQMWALMAKSAIIQKRQTRTNCCQIMFPVVMIIILYLLQQLVNSILESTSGGTIPAIRNPSITNAYLLYPDPVQSDNSCNNAQALQVNSEDGNLVVANNGNADVLQLISNATLDNDVSYTDGIAAYATVRFYDRGTYASTCFKRPYLLKPVRTTNVTSTAEMNSILFNAWKKKTYVGGVNFRKASINNKDFAFSIYSNDTMTLTAEVPRLLSYVTNAIYRTMVKYFTPNNFNKVGTNINFVGTKNFPTPETKFSFDLISLIGPSVYIFIFQLFLPVAMGTLVLEKEKKLREIMSIMGLKQRTYFVVTYAFLYIFYCIAIGITIIIAAALDFRYFTVNDPGTYIILLLIWGHTLIALAFFLSVFFDKAGTATVVGYVFLFAAGILSTNLIGAFFESDDTDPNAINAIMMVPPFAFYRGLYSLRDGVSFGSAGIRMADLSNPRVYLKDAYAALVVEWFFLIVAGLYLEQVLPGAVGVKKHPLFFLQRHYWFPEEKVAISVAPYKKVSHEADDVDNIRRIAHDDVEGKKFALRVVGLRKIWPTFSGKPNIAVRNLSLAVRHGECFGFLGPNGSGKSTTMNMLCGYYMPTNGTAIAAGFDIRDDINAIHQVMGVCPQDNVIWEDMTGREHLMFYGRLKLLSGDNLDKAVKQHLQDVGLWGVAYKKAGEYSGGMKRRLCVANALIGRPRIVLLDEPSTGLDPASKHHLWEAINKYKRSCCMLLTTHSMAEAEVLCDRISILDRSILRCVGSSAELKHRFEKTYKLTITSRRPLKDVEHFVSTFTKEFKVMNNLAETTTFEVSRNSVKLSNIFKVLEANKDSMQISDWGIANTSLEEVFLRITQQPIPPETEEEASVHNVQA